MTKYGILGTSSDIRMGFSKHLSHVRERSFLDSWTDGSSSWCLGSALVNLTSLLLLLSPSFPEYIIMYNNKYITCVGVYRKSLSTIPCLLLGVSCCGYMADIPTCLCQGSSWVVFAAPYERHFTKRILANALRRRRNCHISGFQPPNQGTWWNIHDFGPGFGGAWGCNLLHMGVYQLADAGSLHQDNQ